jgi:hypothetical protein
MMLKRWIYKLNGLLLCCALAVAPVRYAGADGGDSGKADASEKTRGDSLTGTRQFYVAPNGKASNDGSITRPWDLQTALSQPSQVRPGATIWLRGGVYKGGFISRLTGTEAAPIIVRAYPGERVVIDGNGYPVQKLSIHGAWTWYWGFEVMNSRKAEFPVLREAIGEMVDLQGPHTKLINLIAHDNGTAFSFPRNAKNAEIYGCLIFYNGLNTHDHGIYARNESGTKLVTDNIIFAQSGYGFNGTSNQGAVRGFDLTGNILFNNGSLRGTTKRTADMAIGNTQPAARVRVMNNFFYSAPQLTGTSLKIGTNQKHLHKDVGIISNYCVAPNPLIMWRWQKAIVRDNTFYANGKSGRVVAWQALPRDNTKGHLWDRNTYFGGANGPRWEIYQRSGYDLAGWQTQTHLDAHSVALPDSALQDTRIFVRPNLYEPGRAHIVIYNWGHLNAVTADLSATGLKKGQSYQIRDAQNYFGKVVGTGIYDGKPVPINVAGLTAVARPLGVNVPVTHTSSEFQVLVVVPQPAIPSLATLSNAAADSQKSEITLTFSDLLAGAAANLALYQVEINHVAMAISAARLAGGDSITLRLPRGTLHKGDQVVISWRDLPDEKNRLFSGESEMIIAS